MTVACGGGSPEAPNVPRPDSEAEPPFVNSIVSTDFDFIRADDPDAFSHLAFVGRDAREMPDSRLPDDLSEEEAMARLIDDGAFVFAASFSDGSVVELWASGAFGTAAVAEAQARKVTGPLGKLPQLLRRGVSHVVIHDGDAGAFAQEGDPGFFVLYSDNMDVRIANDDLEETVFHESVHAALDAAHAASPSWLAAQAADGRFVTAYARDNPAREDLAESALFAYALLAHPDRLPADVERRIAADMPNRLAYFRTLFP